MRDRLKMESEKARVDSMIQKGTCTLAAGAMVCSRASESNV